MPTLGMHTFLSTTFFHTLGHLSAGSAARIALFALCLCFLGLPISATNQTVGSRDSRFQYQGSWVDQDNGGHQFTRDPLASLSFTFTGVW
jgi:hypothetical protein